MIRQNDEDRQWFNWRGRPGSSSPPRRRSLAPLVEALEGRALLSTLSAPSQLMGTPLAPDRVSLTWTESSTYRYFQVAWSKNGGRSYTTPVSSSTTNYVATGLTPSTTYLFRVRAVNSVTYSSWAGPVNVVTPAAAVYHDGFDADPKRAGSPWTYTTDEWVYGTDPSRGGVLQQTQNGDPPAPTTVDRKAMLSGLPATPSPNDIYARVRIDSWDTGEFARAGVGLYTDPATGRGYNLVFTGRWSNIDTAHPVHLEFLNDGVAWSGWLVNGSQTTVPYATADAPKIGDWYWFHMTVSGGKLYGNVWKDPDPTSPSGTPTGEPAGWTIIYDPASQRAQSQWNRTGGVAALTGSDTGPFFTEPSSGGTVSFDDVSVKTGVIVTSAVSSPAGVSTSTVALAPLVATEAGSMDASTLTDLAREVLRSRRKR